MTNHPHPTRHVPANIHVEHTQLRDLISCPSDSGDVVFASTSGLSARNVRFNQPERTVPNVSFAPTCVATGGGLVAAGGVHAELFLCPQSVIPGSSSSSSSSSTQHLAPAAENWTSTVRLHGSINNALSFTNLALGSSPYHLPLPSESARGEVERMPRLFVSNNDCTMRVYNVATHPSSAVSSEDVDDGVGKRKKRPHRLTKAGVLQATTCINHASVSPDGRTLLSVGDTPSVYLHALSSSSSSSISFEPTLTHTDAFSSGDTAFCTAWSPDGLKYAAASQDGCVKVWDVRSSKALVTLWGERGRRPQSVVPMSKARGRTGRRMVPLGLDPPLPDGSQYMSSISSSSSALGSLFGVPTTASGHYYGYGGFGFPGSLNAVIDNNGGIPDREMELVVPAVRTLKFVRTAAGGGRDVLAFSEHLNNVHIVDGQTFNEHIVLRVPTPAFPPPPMHPQPQPMHALSPSPPRPSLSIPNPSIAPASAHDHDHDPFPASSAAAAWCSPTNSPTTQTQRQEWLPPSGTVLPSNHDHDNQHQQQRPPMPMLYADLRSSVASGDMGMFDPWPSYGTAPHGAGDHRVPPSQAQASRSQSSRSLTGLTGTVYEYVPFMPIPPFRPPQPASVIGRQERRQEEEDGDEDDEDEEDKPQPALLESRRAASAATFPLAAYSSNTYGNPFAAPEPPCPHPSSMSRSNNGSKGPSNIHIAHHPATRTRAAYDEKHDTVHLSGMCFDPSGRYLYASTERSIAQWDMEDVLGGSGNYQRETTVWGKMTCDAGAEWA